MRTARALGMSAVAVALASGIASCIPPNQPTTTLNLVAYQTQGTLTRPCDACFLQGSKSSNAGAQYFAAETLKRNGVVIGHDVLYVPLVSSDGTGEFFITLDIAGGQMSAQGIGNVQTGKGALAITGGTGLYRGVTGAITFHSVSDTVTNVTVSIDR